MGLPDIETIPGKITETEIRIILIKQNHTRHLAISYLHVAQCTAMHCNSTLSRIALVES